MIPMTPKERARSLVWLRDRQHYNQLEVVLRGDRVATLQTPKAHELQGVMRRELEREFEDIDREWRERLEREKERLVEDYSDGMK